MGLDIVELVMRIEEEFSIDIPDEDAEHLSTIGRIDQYLAFHLNTPQEQRQRQWERLLDVIAEEAHVSRSSLSRETKLAGELYG